MDLNPDPGAYGSKIADSNFVIDLSDTGPFKYVEEGF
jgi:hypothetical protein